MSKKIAIYGRVSTRDQETDNQIVQLADYAQKQGWEVVETIVDVASGSKGRTERKGLDRVFTLAHQRKIDVVLFWALDRFSREGSRTTITYLAQLEAAGVGFHSYTESYLSSLGPFGDAIISLLAALAKQERIRIGERTKAGMARARAEGKRIGRPRSDDTLAIRASKLRQSGMTFAAVGRELGISRAKAYHLVQTFIRAQNSPGVV